LIVVSECYQQERIMTLNRLMLIFLGVWALLTGIFLVTNLRVDWQHPLTGFAALILGIICIICAIKDTPR